MEETYLPKYSEYEAESFTQGTSGFYLRHVKNSTPNTSLILRYRERFSILGFFRFGVKLGFDFPRVLLNKKLQTWSLNLDFDEEINPMLGSLKNSTSMKSPNYIRILSKRITCTTSNHKRQETQKLFLGKNTKDKTS